MISIEEALAAVQANTLVPRTETVFLLEATGRSLAEDILANLDSPPYSNSAMDGFAVCWEDVKDCASDQTVQLTIVGESQAGEPFVEKVKRGEAIRISTGAIMPEGADSVIPIEDCNLAGGDVQINAAVRSCQHVRYRGEEFKAGTPLLKTGTWIGPAQVGLLASMGVAKLKVYVQPRIAVIITGKELVAFDAPADAHQLRDSNRPMLKTAIEEAGGQVVFAKHVGDHLESTIQTIREAEEKSEIIFLSGGVSMGVHDHVKTAAESCGYKRVFWKVNQKPGKPLFFAQKENHLLMGLPGNPVSAFMCFQHYGRSLLQASRGAPFSRSTIKASLNKTVVNKSQRSTMFRVVLEPTRGGAMEARFLDHQGSHMLTSIAHANGYFVLKGDHQLPANSIIDVYEF